eukprot:jgi/Tetstr1/427728/TSEL_017852.t1
MAAPLLRLLCALCLLPLAAPTLDRLTGDGTYNGSPDNSSSISGPSGCELILHPRKKPRPGGKGTAGNDPLTRGWCRKLVQSRRYHNSRCDVMPWVIPSHGCSVPSEPSAWMPATQRTVWLWGDSVLEQLWDHLLCFLGELAQPVQEGAGAARGSGRSLLKARSGGKQGPRIAWGQRGAKGRLVARPLAWNPELAGEKCAPYRDCIRFGTVRVCFGDRFRDAAWEQPSTVSCFLNSGPGDVHVLNYGLWHNDALGVPVATSKLAQFLKDAGAQQKLPHLVWFESTPQHFKSKGGLYYSDTTKIAPGGCMVNPSMRTLAASEFRNRLTLSTLNDAELLRVAPLHVFRSWALLAPHPKLHTQHDDGKLDCTHWCQYDGNVLTATAQVLLSDISRAFWQS